MILQNDTNGGKMLKLCLVVQHWCKICIISLNFQLYFFQSFLFYFKISGWHLATSKILRLKHKLNKNKDQGDTGTGIPDQRSVSQSSCYVEFLSNPSLTFSDILRYSIPFPQCFHRTHPFQNSLTLCLLLHSTSTTTKQLSPHLSWKLYALGTITEPIWTLSEHPQNIMDTFWSQYNLGTIWNH